MRSKLGTERSEVCLASSRSIQICTAVGLYLSLLLREKGDHEVVDEESTSSIIKCQKMTPHPSAFGCHLSRCGSVTLGL